MQKCLLVIMLLFRYATIQHEARQHLLLTIILLLCGSNYSCSVIILPVDEDVLRASSTSELCSLV